MYSLIAFAGLVLSLTTAAIADPTYGLANGGYLSTREALAAAYENHLEARDALAIAYEDHLQARDYYPASFSKRSNPAELGSIRARNLFDKRGNDCEQLLQDRLEKDNPSTTYQFELDPQTKMPLLGSPTVTLWAEAGSKKSFIDLKHHTFKEFLTQLAKKGPGHIEKFAGTKFCFAKTIQNYLQGKPSKPGKSPKSR